MVVKNERKRYILLELMDQGLDKISLDKKLRKKIRFLAGEIFLGYSNLHIIETDKPNFLIVRCNHTSREIVEAAIQLVADYFSTYKINTISGTIKKIMEIVTFEDIADEE